MPALTIHETTRLAELERTIESGLATFVQVGQALLEVRNGRLYRAEYRTFEAYCRDRWGMGRTHAYRLIDASEVAGSLRDRLPPHAKGPANELQARELGRVPAAEQPRVWQAATAGGTRTTAARIREVAGQAPRDDARKRLDRCIRAAERLVGETRGLGDEAEGALRDFRAGLKKLRRLV